MSVPQGNTPPSLRSTGESLEKEYSLEYIIIVGAALVSFKYATQVSHVSLGLQAFSKFYEPNSNANTHMHHTHSLTLSHAHTHTCIAPTHSHTHILAFVTDSFRRVRHR